MGKKTYGASKGEYIAGQALISKIQSDVDEDGETISGSKKKKVTQTIQNSNLSDNAKVAVLAGSYEKLADYANKSYDYGMGYGNFVEIYNEISQLSSDKNYKGETVSESLKKKQLRILYKWGLRGKQLQLFKEMLNIK